MSIPIRIQAALKAAFWHLLISALVVLAAAALVFGLWYPFPYSKLVGGQTLFFLVAGVDVVCGPLLTLVIFNPAKPPKDLVRDLGIVALIQLAALGYGVYSVALARPVYLVFQVNDFRAVIAADVNPDELALAPTELQSLPWWGPKLMGTRSSRDDADRANAINMALQGQEISMRPSWWQSYETNRAQVLGASKAIPQLIARQPSARALIDAAVQKAGLPEASLHWLPLVSRQSSDWVVLIDKTTAEVRGFAHVDGYEIEPAKPN
jgi:hypothetical protein